MRIIAGTLRSRSLQAPPGLATRPTSDRLRETLFNVLAPRIVGAHFLDLYAGSGAVGIEALSRGAAQAVFIERAAPVVSVLRKNLANLGVNDSYQIGPASVASYLRNVVGAAFDIVFLDPPYDAEDEYAMSLGLLGRRDPRSSTARGSSISSGQALGHSQPWHAHSSLRPGAVVIAEHRRKHLLNQSYGVLHRTRLLEQGDAALSFYSVNETAAGTQEREP
ncbi:MAG TPA: 16S rRNA (guanine(966)-N(2))-methyltransferase RsmD [Terracidiphilus sp.]|jgi:16S rRNA (guanine(966)-N(2))-methyltransferase RsmD